MNIGLDYDNTYTRDPKLWNEFIISAQRRGHRVYCVTMRHPEEADSDFQKSIAVFVDAVHFTGRRAKEPWCDEQRIRIDVWIDDSPTWLLKDAR